MGRISQTGCTFNGHRMVGSERPSGFRTECPNPKFVQTLGPDGYRVSQVACTKCKHCLWVKRETRATSVAWEIERSDWALWITLTIGPKGEAFGYHKQIDKTLMQNFHKVCRIHIARKSQGFRGRDVKSWRYVQCGEYGERKGRAHYHCVIFGKGDRPLWGDKDADRIHIHEWPWGHVNVKTTVDRGVAFYLSKYMRKRGTAWWSASSAYAIGAEKARDIGRSIAGKALLPTVDWRHSSADAAGRVRRALITGSKQREMLEAFFAGSGQSVVSVAKLWPRNMWSSVMRLEVDIRRRALGLTRRHVLSIERIKRQVKAEFYEALDFLPLTSNGGPVRPADWKPVYPDWSKDNDDEAKERETRRTAAACSIACGVAARAAAAAGRDVAAAVASVRDRFNRGADVGEDFFATA